MERAAAHKIITKLLGKGWKWEHHPNALTDKDERAAANATLKAVTEERRKTSEEMTARRQALCAADPEYQRLCEQYRAQDGSAKRWSGLVHTHKFVVGKSNSLFFHVHAEGDSWEEVIEKLKASKRSKE